MPSTPSLAIVIALFNNWALTAACLESLAATTGGSDYELILVDNASTDETATGLAPLCRTLFGPRARIFRLEQNRNFGPASTLGAYESTAKYVFFLNNDTKLTKDWAPPLLNALDNDPGLGAVGPLLLYPDDSVQHLGVAFTMGHMVHLYQHFPHTHPLVGKKRSFQCITAAALLMPRDLFLSLGGFFPEYANGYEDLDLCLRLRSLGKRLTVEPASRIYHLEGQSSGRKANDAENARLFTRRCARLLSPDLHIHGLRDGLRPWLDDALDLELSLPEKDEEELSQKASALSVPDLHRLLAAHPLWLSGKRLLAARLLADQMIPEALALLAEVAQDSQTCGDYRALLALEHRAPFAASLFQAAREEHARLDATRKNAHLAKKRLNQAMELRDKTLISLYTGHIEALGQGR
ncbi:MAG: glycosyltransferase family 2 protein [Desulfovibrio sp.]|nr:glycosyltransferase family 2 protein [Desulfovibrio sp.]